MQIELVILFLAVVIGFVQLFLATSAATRQLGTEWNISSRDGGTPKLTGYAGRMDRAFANFKETFPFFAAAILMVVISGEQGVLSMYGAITYLVARCVYYPLYVFNVIFVRSLVWLISCLGIFSILIELWF